MWSCPIEIPNVSTQDTIQLLLTDDQYMIQALSPDTSKETFTDRIGSWSVIGCFEDLYSTRCSYTSETRPKFAIVITNQILWYLPIRRSLSKLLRYPGVGR